MSELMVSNKKIGFISEFRMNMMKNERWAVPIPHQHITIMPRNMEGIAITESEAIRARFPLINCLKVRVPRVQETVHSDPLDTDTQWFVMPKDLKETFSGKSVGHQGELSGWSCYDDET